MPRLTWEHELKYFYAKRWLRNNFGGRFCRMASKVPGGMTAMFMFCDYDRTDFARKKEDRFTMMAVPFTFFYFVLPYGWIILKWIFHLIFECCAWNVYVEEEDESPE